MSRLRAALIIFLVAIGVRGFLLSRTSISDILYGRSTEHGFISGEEGINVAVALSSRLEFSNPFGGHTGPTAHLPPMYPFMTAAVYRVFGYGYAAAVVRNSIGIAGLAALYASFPAAATALGIGANAGIIAGIIAALFPAFRSSEVFRGRDEWLAALVFLWLTVFLYRICCRKQPRTQDIVIYSAGWGLLLHIQPSTLAVLPIHAFLLWRYADWSAPRQRLKQGLVATTILILMCTPWIIRNYRTMGGWFFIRDNLGLELFISNAEDAQPSLEANMATHRYCRIHPICSAAAADEIRRVGELTFNRQLLKEALSWIASHPGSFGELTISRIAIFWTDLPANRFTFAFRLLLSALGWVGLVLMWRANLRLQVLLLTSILAAYPVIYYLVQYSNRYVLTISFAIFLPAGFALEHLGSKLRRRAHTNGQLATRPDFGTAAE